MPKVTLVKKTNQVQLRYEEFDKEDNEYRLYFFENFQTLEEAELTKKELLQRPGWH